MPNLDDVPQGVAMTMWIIGVSVAVGLAVVWWRDRRHHGRVDQGRMDDARWKTQYDDPEFH